MPTYQYRCTACSNELEIVQKFTDSPLTTCPECSGSLRKVFNAVGVVFKGSGFYRNDSRGKSSSTETAASSSSSDSGSSSTSTSSTSSDSTSSTKAAAASAS
jgi:putative FmdB family regulatory protein